MPRARVFRRPRNGFPVLVRTAQPFRAKFVFPDGFTTQDQYGNYSLLRNAPGDSVYAFSFPFGPQDLKYDKFSPKFQELSRPFKKPLLVPDSSSLRTVSFNAVIADRDSGGKLSISESLERLEAIADSGAAFQFTYGLNALPFSVVLTQFSYSVSYRNLEGEPIRAEVSIQLTESVFADQELVILKAVHRTPAPTVTPRIPSTTTTTTTTTTPITTEEDPPPILYIPDSNTGINKPANDRANSILAGGV